MKKNKLTVYLAIVIILFAGVLYFSLRNDYRDILNTLKDVNILFLLIGVFFMFLSKYFLGETLYFLAKKEKKDIKMKDMALIELIYPFFAGITPSALGGESFEIFYMRDCGIPIGKGSNIAIQKFITYQISLLLINTVAVILNLFMRVVPFNSFIFSFVVINFIINGILLGFFFLVAYNRKFNHFIMKKGLQIGHKLHLVRNIEKTREKLDSYLKNFDEGVEKLRKDKKLFFKVIGIQMLSFLFYMLAAYPVAVSMGITNISAIKMFILATYVKMLSLIFITPGNSGAAEYNFLYLFTGLITESEIMAFMLMWRFVTYYIPLIFGGLLAIVWKKVKNNYE